MVTTILKQILIDSGCTHVIYESNKIANLFTDEATQFDIVGLIVQPDDLVLEVRANAIAEHHQFIIVEVMEQVRLEDTADNNEVKLQELLDICKEIIVRLIAEGKFKSLKPVTVVKILETKYDANVIGWSLPLDLYYLNNETRIPCL